MSTQKVEKVFRVDGVLRPSLQDLYTICPHAEGKIHVLQDSGVVTKHNPWPIAADKVGFIVAKSADKFLALVDYWIDAI